MISVVIPIRNEEKTLEEAINSVLKQDVEDMEIICVFNGCTDRSEEIARSIRDDRIKIFHSEPGIVPALNEGLRRSSGSLIARQDADDIWYEGKLKKQVSYLEDNPHIDILGTQMRVVDGSDIHLSDTTYPTVHEEMVKYIFTSQNPIGHPSVVFRRKILDRCAGYYDLFQFAEDMDLWTRSIPWYRMANLNEVLVKYKWIPNPKYDNRVPKTLSTWYGMIYGIK